MMFGLTINRIFFWDSGTNLPYSRIIYLNCRSNSTFETACFANFDKINSLIVTKMGTIP